MSRFPKSAHDDRIDALAHVVRLAVEKLVNARMMRIITTQSTPIKHSGTLVGGTGAGRRSW
jgi:hypothetical protein